MKHIVVTHTAALALLARLPDPRYGDNVAPGSDAFVLRDAAVPTDLEAAEIIETLHLEVERLDVLAADPQARRHSKHLTTHLCTKPLPAGSFIAVDYWRKDIVLYVVCPELAFLQSLSIGDDLDAIYAGYMLTSDYRIDHLEPSGVVNRQDAWCDGRLTTRHSIENYLSGLLDSRSVKRTKALLAYVNEASRSPRESALAMLFSLPLSRGGFAAGHATLNKQITIQEKGGSVIRYPDILLSARPQWAPRGKALPCEREPRHVALDYDSDSDHKRIDRFERDALRRNEMEMLNDIAHFTITKIQANDFDYLVKLAKRIKRKLRIRPGYNLPSGLSDTERACKERAIERRQFDLWERFVMRRKLW